ncbi:STAS/SEC14 domain-containing protein [Arthrobacter sp. SIMBA_036]|uniref:DUF7793 family protein n=1 Tax=Arthrobacter sp. SIMBA_036 TaxID=3085778 RepID=UPI0039784A89
MTWSPGVRLDAEMALAALAAVNGLANGASLPLMVDMAGMAFLSNGARQVFAAPSTASRVALVGASPVDRMLADYQLGTGPVPCPVRFFMSRDDALTWLGQARPSD